MGQGGGGDEREEKVERDERAREKDIDRVGR